MTLLIIKTVLTGQSAIDAARAKFFAEVLAFFSIDFECLIAEKHEDAEDIIAREKISAVVFVSQAMLSKAKEFGETFPETKMIVFSGKLDGDLVKINENIFFIQKDKGSGHLTKALEIIKSN